MIERQLAHGERIKVRAADNRVQYLQERRKMMQWSAGYLNETVGKKQLVFATIILGVVEAQTRINRWKTKS